jgi:hypothetical protein
VVGYEFESSIKSFRKSFELSRTALADAAEKIRSDLAAYLAGDEWIGERTEDGHTIWDQEQVYEMEIEAAEEAIQELRQTYLIAIYHRWERAVRLYTKSDEQSHAKLVRDAEKHGIHPLPKVENISQLVNLLKHNNLRWAEKVRTSWPDVMNPHILNRKDGDFSASVVLTDDHVYEVLNAVAASGPVAFPGKQP